MAYYHVIVANEKNSSLETNLCIVCTLLYLYAFGPEKTGLLRLQHLPRFSALAAVSAR